MEEGRIPGMRVRGDGGGTDFSIVTSALEIESLQGQDVFDQSVFTWGLFEGSRELNESTRDHDHFVPVTLPSTTVTFEEAFRNTARSSGCFHAGNRMCLQFSSVRAFSNASSHTCQPTSDVSPRVLKTYSKCAAVHSTLRIQAKS